MPNLIKKKEEKKLINKNFMGKFAYKMKKI